MTTLIRNASLALIALFPLLTIAGDGRISKDIAVENFDRIALGDATHLIVVQGSIPTLTVTASEALMDKVMVEQSGNSLRLGVTHMTWSWFNWWKNRSEGEILFEVQVPRLKELRVGGASKVLISGLQSGDLQLNLSGASQLSVNRLILDNLSMNLSGASKMTIGKIDAKKIEAGLSGASNAKIGTLQTEMLKFDGSGASQLTITDPGKTGHLTIHTSGASQYHGKVLVANNVEVHASGGSQAYVYASESLESHSSSGSHVEYSGTPKKLDIGSSGTVASK